MEQIRKMPAFDVRIALVILALILVSLGCGFVQTRPTSTPSKPVAPTRTPTGTLLPTETLAPTDTPESTGTLIHLWASGAEASSQYGSWDSPDWSAQAASGPPDTLECGDHATAWATAASDSIDTITLYYYDQPVVPTEVNIIQSYNPSQVVRVELLDPYGEFTDANIYETEPMAVDECPYRLSIPVTTVDHLVMGIRLTIDQSVLGLGWNEIDAVELVGYAAAGYEPPTSKPPPGDEVWENVYALPIWPNAENVNYLDDYNLQYSVSDANRQELLDFLFSNLELIGWRLDVDENGVCLDANHCPSKSHGLDYGSPGNVMWYFIHQDSPRALLSLSVSPDGASWSVAMTLD